LENTSPQNNEREVKNMNITTTACGAKGNANNSWWKATLAAEKFNGRKEIKKTAHANPAIDAIHNNPDI